MKVLVLTPYPPYSGEAVEMGMHAVKQRVQAGHEVSVVSPSPSAAHHHASMRGPRGALGLLPWVRKFDEVVVQLDTGMFVRPEKHRVLRLLDAVCLSLALRAAKQATVQVADLNVMGVAPTGRAARPVWSAADRVVVASDHDRSLLTVTGLVPAERIEQIALRRSADSDTSLGRVSADEEVTDVPVRPWDQVVSARVDRSEIQAQIRARARAS